ncbi:cytochrome D ubiquinol oxidase subunit II [Halorubrum sp. E3]|nr:cytochrome D ubiquinol oxidase subunit II [Halorubrum sp. E3]
MTSAVDALAAGPVFGLPLPELWFALVFAILGTFLFLDGFDFGAGAIFATLREDAAREAVLSAIGPFWDGNEVWLVVFGGALFAAFPSVYAGLFSRHYLLMFGILGALILRGLAPEMYEQRRDERWQRWWGRSFVAGSVLAPFLLGAFAGNWLVGTPRSLTLVGVVTGVTVTALTVVSGAAFLRLKARDALPETVTQIGVGAVAAYLLAVVATLGVGVTAFLLAAAGVTGLLAASIEVSALVGLPVGILVGAASAAATWLRLWKNPDARPALLGVAAAGYAVVALAAASYAISSVRGVVSVERALAVALLVGVVAFALARRRPDRFD